MLSAVMLSADMLSVVAPRKIKQNVSPIESQYDQKNFFLQ